uniref:MYND-type domain-containing protein n=1 Tax=Skeletonema marinoi TaxID=267567 RepID=A0A7S2Q2D3_9STRA|mmetsp:Transcript_35686/g.72973  ORF Transcript_35686/g.72973 Transcript_35686/m.72973 type:complete len:559 (+) Transcript_35686:1071-2747(+)|eukprot:CAMPEP_0113397708 /NCGR_PEP_ID=MMETSP0013_2-20120614/14540_1 /TAXON_ID=2843 ORGANISM="Skeletonema costatum, Strain 1716" /NCGR_SAMPLE_ID=MMETSP0013_2 /ASSEMBLY_ACC=CAM_ASM_000158 /LENGTH=558 /DNA_ID=CAMNT_0000282341 /DNA_START=54 /DNA_END=1730 /DNA_ORIENTATION=- /assembly_acc=CAM_ASM_000158
MDISALFKGLQNVFGESQYKEITENLEHIFYMRPIPYRDKEYVCVDFISEESPSDKDIINSHLSKLTYDELNALDDNGASILHLAVQYNRGGQTGSYSRMDKETNNNIIKWLLDNPAFNQEDAKGKFCSEKYVLYQDLLNPPMCRGNALHLAFAAQVPKGIQFYSENHGGEFGSTYVAGGALDIMLNHKKFARAHINSCNEDGHSVLEYALQMAMARLRKIDSIIFVGYKAFDECYDCSKIDYAEDYPSNIQKLLRCKNLRVHSTFGIVMTSNEEGNYLMPEQLVHRERRSILNLTPTKGMKVFIKLCTQYYRMSGGKRDTIVNAILMDNVGQLPDSVKAQSMSVCISSQSRGEWIFNPCKLSDKKIGAVVRKFFVKHADSALYAIQRYTSIIHREYDESLLCNVRDALCERHSLSSKLWKNILAYAGYRNENSSRLERLSDLNDTIQNSVLPFFYGGIQSCVNRKLEEHVPADAWGLIFQFAGLRPSFPQNLDEILGPLVKDVCGHCMQRKEKLLICTRCKIIKYCGRDCQRADWPIHRNLCKGSDLNAASKRQRYA